MREMDKGIGTNSGRKAARHGEEVSSGSLGAGVGLVGPSRKGMGVDFLGLNCRGLPWT